MFWLGLGVIGLLGWWFWPSEKDRWADEQPASWWAFLDAFSWFDIW
jgi:hypothetical protein